MAFGNVLGAKLMQFEWHDYVGAIGVALLLGTYFCLQINRIAAQSLLYSQLNAVGSLLILVSLSQRFNLSAFVVEASWFVISIVGIVVTIYEKSDGA
ncbi:MAG: hypothetical protein AAF497_04195 [Planctomycetota bacterium]